jgi:hypothetical protein
MRTIQLTTVVALLTCTAALAHERITIGPRGGRVVYLDSTEIPSVEFFVDKEQRGRITLLDKERKPMAPAERSVVVTAGPRAGAKKLKIEPEADGYVTEALPAGAPYTVVIQIKERPGAKGLTARVNYDPTPARSGKPVYIDDSVNEGSGPRLKVPETLDRLFAEINQHHGELKDGFKEKKYEALDEVTQAFTVLLKALPGKSGDKASAVQPQVDTLVADLDAIADANARRTLTDAAKSLDHFDSALISLKKQYPEKTANAKL